MDLRQLRYFVRVVELGGVARAARDLDLVQSALSQQIGRLESELSTRLLHRTPQGVSPTEAGLAFFREAQLTLRHAEQARRAAQHARLSGTVSIGMAPTTAAILGMPLLQAMRERYPAVRVHLVESLSGYLSQMLSARQLDLAILFDSPLRASPVPQQGRRWSALPVLQEHLFLIRSVRTVTSSSRAGLRLARLRDLDLILPTGPHGLRSMLEAAFARAGLSARVVLEIDSLAMLMEAVDAGMGATLQPWAAVARFPDRDRRFVLQRITDPGAQRINLLCALPDEELSPAALAARVVLRAVIAELFESGRWTGVEPVGPGYHEK